MAYVGLQVGSPTDGLARSNSIASEGSTVRQNTDGKQFGNWKVTKGQRPSFKADIASERTVNVLKSQFDQVTKIQRANSSSSASRTRNNVSKMAQNLEIKSTKKILCDNIKINIAKERLEKQSELLIIQLYLDEKMLCDIGEEDLEGASEIKERIKNSRNLFEECTSKIRILNKIPNILNIVNIYSDFNGGPFGEVFYSFVKGYTESVKNICR